MTQIILSPAKIKEALDFYQKHQKVNKWQRIDYNGWRLLVKLSKSQDYIELEYKINTWCGKDNWYTSYFSTSSYSDIYMILPGEFISLLSNEMEQKEVVQKIENTNNIIKEDTTTMTVPAMNFDFGPVNPDSIAISPYGMAVKNKNGQWFTYDGNKVIDVTGFTFNFNNMIYKMPAAVKDLRPGDMVLHKGVPMYVESVDSGTVSVIDILASEAKVVLPVSNMFGFDFVTRIVSFVNLDTAQPDADNPFGNIMPFMMMDMVFNGKNSSESENIDFGKMMVMSAMFNGKSNPFANLFNFGSRD